MRISSPDRRCRSTAGCICTKARPCRGGTPHATPPGQTIGKSGLRPAPSPCHLPSTGGILSARKEGPAMNAPRNTRYRHLDVQKIAGSLGAEVRGVDLSQDVSDEVLAEIRAALL